MKKREAKANTVLNAFLRQVKDLHMYYELKHAKNGRFNYKSGFEPHQVRSLIALKNSGMVWKWSDQDQRLKPCDGASLPPLPTYVIIKFDRSFYFIDIEVMVNEMGVSGNASLTEDRAKEISERILVA